MGTSSPINFQRLKNPSLLSLYFSSLSSHSLYRTLILSAFSFRLLRRRTFLPSPLRTSPPLLSSLKNPTSPSIFSTSQNPSTSSASQYTWPNLSALFFDKKSSGDSATKRHQRDKVVALKEELLGCGGDAENIGRLLEAKGVPLFRSYYDGSAVVELLK